MKILCINSRKGVGDQVIFTPYLHAISKMFKTPISLLAKNNSKAKDLFADDNHINEIITLEKEMDGISGIFKLEVIDSIFCNTLLILYFSALIKVSILNDTLSKFLIE